MSSTFAKDSQQQRAYIHRLVNKGLSIEQQLSNEEIDNLISKAEQEGMLSQNGHSSLTSQAIDQLWEKKQKDTQAEVDRGINQAEDNVVGYILPATRSASNSRLKEMSRMGFRSQEVLAELELEHGRITASSVITYLKKKTDMNNGADSYNVPIKNLVKNGYITFDKTNGNQIIQITTKGEQLIADMKAYPELIKSASKETKVGHTAFKIIDYILSHTNNEPDVWLYPEGNTTAITLDLAEELGMSEDAFTRRFYSLRTDKKFLESKLSPVSDRATVIVNAKVTDAGLEYADRIREKFAVQEDLLDDDAVWEVEMMTQECIALSEELGETFTAKRLRDQRDKKHLFEFTQKAFTQEARRISRLLTRLQNELEFENAA